MQKNPYQTQRQQWVPTKSTVDVQMQHSILLH